jgi:hypothetical protein
VSSQTVVPCWHWLSWHVAHQSLGGCGGWYTHAAAWVAAVQQLPVTGNGCTGDQTLGYLLAYAVTRCHAALAHAALWVAGVGCQLRSQYMGCG